jgi:hypothetical protein
VVDHVRRSALRARHVEGIEDKLGAQVRRHRPAYDPAAPGPQSGSAFLTVIIIERSTFKLDGDTAVFEDVGAGFHGEVLSKGVD